MCAYMCVWESPFDTRRETALFGLFNCTAKQSASSLFRGKISKYGKSEAAAYCRKALEKVGRLTGSLFSLMPQGPLWGLKCHRNSAHLF